MLTSRTLLSYLGVLLLIFFYYTWIVFHGHVASYWVSIPYSEYNRLTDAFLRGHTALAVVPDPRLDQAPNPYLGGQVLHAFVMPDYAYYRSPRDEHGHYYLYWGPAPVVALFLPWELITGVHLTYAQAQLIIAFGIVVFYALIIHSLARWFPRVLLLQQLLLLVISAVGSLQPYMLVAHDVNRTAIMFASLCLAAGLYFILSALSTKPKDAQIVSHTRLALASLCFGLAHLSRAAYALDFMGFALILIYLVPLRSWGTALVSGKFYGTVAVLFLPMIACLAISFWYNANRFDYPFEFGFRYQMAPGKETIYGYSYFQVKYLSDGLFDYLIAPWAPYPEMPYIIPLHNFYVPHFLHNSRLCDYPVSGVLFCFPVLWAGLGWYGLLHRASKLTGPLLLFGFVATSCFMIHLLIITSFWTICYRYAEDFLNPLIIMSFLGSMALMERGTDRYALALGTGVLYSILIGFLFGWPFYKYNM